MLSFYVLVTSTLFYFWIRCVELIFIITMSLICHTIVQTVFMYLCVYTAMDNLFDNDCLQYIYLYTVDYEFICMHSLPFDFRRWIHWIDNYILTNMKYVSLPESFMASRPAKRMLFLQVFCKSSTSCVSYMTNMTLISTTLCY